MEISQPITKGIKNFKHLGPKKHKRNHPDAGSRIFSIRRRICLSIHSSSFQALGKYASKKRNNVSISSSVPIEIRRLLSRPGVLKIAHIDLFFLQCLKDLFCRNGLMRSENKIGLGIGEGKSQFCKTLLCMFPGSYDLFNCLSKYSLSFTASTPAKRDGRFMV